MNAISLPATPESPSCRNCGAALGLADGRLAHYCPDCGQETDPRPPTVLELGRQLISHYASAEGRLWPTLWGLIARPGFLTTEYFAGRRRRYIIPTRLYLTASILFFVLVKVLGAGSLVKVDDSPKPAKPAAEQSSPVKKPPEISNAGEAAKGAIDEARKEIVEEFAKANAKSKAPASLYIGPGKSGAGMGDPFLKAVECDSFGAFCAKIKSYLSAKYGDITVREFGHRLKERMISLAPYAVFMLLPVFALMTRVLYWRRGLYYAEHLIYALHVHAFAFLLLLTVALLPEVLTTWVMLAGMVYFWLAMRNVFGGRWWMTTIRYATLGMAYPVLMSFSIVLVLLFAIFV
ncbi:MAG: DUF3667 domain-containing protein [Betaproteobacteria bacterium]|nr:DUF3667 domain-containing protein [Betaproteobacteria bacterium]